MTEVSLHGPNGEFAGANKRTFDHPNPDGRPVDENNLPVLFSQAGGASLPRASRVFAETLIPAGVSPDAIFGAAQP